MANGLAQFSYNPSLSFDEQAMRFDDPNRAFTASTGTGSYSPTTNSDPNFMSTMGDYLSNRDFMAGAMGVGQLGLGLANYLQMRPVYEEQLKGLEQNRRFMAEDQARRARTRENFDRVLG